MNPLDNNSKVSHAALEAAAIANGRTCLSSAMEYGFVGPIDIPAEAFHSELLPVARVVRAARENGAREFVDVLLYLVQSTDPGEAQDLLRSKIADVAEAPHYRPEALQASAAVVYQHYAFKRRQHLLWRLNRANEEGEPIDEILRQLGEVEAGGDSRKSKPKPFEFFQADHLDGTSEVMDFVEGLLTEGGASVIYGPSNCGKSFWIVDLGASVASGTDFRDELEVEQGAVVYVALEGASGARNRISALKQAGRLKPGAPFFLIFEAVSLLEAGHTDRLAKTITKISEEAGLKVRLVILDTMARAMAGGDENSGQDMTAAVKSIDAIRSSTGAHVAIVHHCGKDEARGARGHSSLRAAVDTEIEVSRSLGESVSTVRVTKQRDLQVGSAMPFSLEVITLGTDRRGKPITSCIVRHEDEMMASKPGVRGRPPAATDEELLALLPAPSTAAWERAASDEHGVSKSAFHRALKRLHGHGAQKEISGWTAA